MMTVNSTVTSTIVCKMLMRLRKAIGRVILVATHFSRQEKANICLANGQLTEPHVTALLRMPAPFVVLHVGRARDIVPLPHGGLRAQVGQQPWGAG